jgi:hypothetical protein
MFDDDAAAERNDWFTPRPERHYAADRGDEILVKTWKRELTRRTPRTKERPTEDERTWDRKGRIEVTTSVGVVEEEDGWRSGGSGRFPESLRSLRTTLLPEHEPSHEWIDGCIRLRERS